MNGNNPEPSMSINALQNMHQLLLEALRHREQAIIRFLVILGPALGGFVLLLQRDFIDKVYISGTIGVQILLLLGSVYSIALGYNYRYIIFQLAKIEAALRIASVMLVKWPRSLADFEKQYVKKDPRCIPPEIIRVFWLIFNFGILGVTVTAYDARLEILELTLILFMGSISLWIAVWAPYYYGNKIKNSVLAEIKAAEGKETVDTYGFFYLN